MLPLFIALGAIGTGLIAFTVIFFILKNKKRTTVTKTAPATPPQGVVILSEKNVQPRFPNISTGDFKLYDSFQKEYPLDQVNYRKGAAVTCHFNMSEGFRVKPDGNLEWGYVRIHSGVDRAGGGTVGNINDVVMAPFNFERSWIQEFGPVSYGTLISLLSDKYQFEFRIAHMQPGVNIVPWTYNQIRAGNPVKKDWLIGSAGTYGYSSGNHTHTEIKSLDESCEIFDIHLEQKFGNKIFQEYDMGEVIMFYRNQSYWHDKSEKAMLQDWAEQKKLKRIIFSNKYLYRCVYVDDKVYTWYNTWELFNL